MKSPAFIVLGVVASLAIVSAQAQTYQWKDGNGRTVISDTPPPGKPGSSRAIGAPMPTSSKEAPPEKAADAARSSAEKDLEFKKRQQDAKDKADKDAKDQSAARERQDACERARQNLAGLGTDQPVATFNDKGERTMMNSAQREQEMERIRKFLAETCK